MRWSQTPIPIRWSQTPISRDDHTTPSQCEDHRNSIPTRWSQTPHFNEKVTVTPSQWDDHTHPIPMSWSRKPHPSEKITKSHLNEMITETSFQPDYDTECSFRMCVCACAFAHILYVPWRNRKGAQAVGELSCISWDVGEPNHGFWLPASCCSWTHGSDINKRLFL